MSALVARWGSHDLRFVTFSAIANYNKYRSWLTGITAHLGGEKSFLARITVNHLRHQWMNYDRLLREIPADSGEKVFLWLDITDAIAQDFPSLRDEAERQMEFRFDVPRAA